MAMYKKALTVWVAALGPDHALVGECYNNMAGVLDQLGTKPLSPFYDRPQPWACGYFFFSYHISKAVTYHE